MRWICAASATVAALLFTTVTPGAGWRRTRYSHESYLEMMRRTGKEVPLLLQKVLGLRQNTGTSYKAWAFEGGTLPSPKEGRRDAAAHFFAGRSRKTKQNVLMYSEDKKWAPAAVTIT